MLQRWSNSGLQFAANLNWLWTELPFIERIGHASKAGFKAVEAGFPYSEPVESIAKAIQEHNLKWVLLNTPVEEGELGWAAVCGKEEKFKEAFSTAYKYATTLQCSRIHVMAGKFEKTATATETFIKNLRYAADVDPNITILIEPLNSYDVPQYFLSTTQQAIDILHQVDRKNVKLQFDIYHVQQMEGNILKRLEEGLKGTEGYSIGHIQFAAVPARNEPQLGELNFDRIFGFLQQAKYEGYLGAEYKPLKDTDDSLIGWFTAK
eukprot:TRINITY_DN66400_c4_g1_i1.p1 TRINITY_DN66400_c4_g1~~TRINITY_DN66400_c4_g1_i1.p1  ORF type:complete len:264 (-),score=26.69 TRINITY_DN66400_c4_g1_i1:453-1244(-)